MKILVTGSNGLLGSHLVRTLLEDGYAVRAMIFPGSYAKTLDGLPVERVEGNICNLDDIMAAMEGCEGVIHAAASTKVWPIHSKESWEINLEGTKNVVRAAIALQIKRLVYVGSASSFQNGSKEHPSDEHCPLDGCTDLLDYVDSKLMAQEYVLQAVREKGLPAVVVNPTFMFGEYDSQPSSGKMIIAIYQKLLPGYASGGKNFVYARDVARACINALTKGRVGECYIAGNVNLNYKELFEIIGHVVGAKPPQIKFPNAAILLYGYLGTLKGLLFRQPPNINHALAKISCADQYYSPSKAVKELHMPQTPIEEAIRAEFNWLKVNHYC